MKANKAYRFIESQFDLTRLKENELERIAKIIHQKLLPLIFKEPNGNEELKKLIVITMTNFDDKKRYEFLRYIKYENIAGYARLEFHGDTRLN